MRCSSILGAPFQNFFFKVFIKENKTYVHGGHGGQEGVEPFVLGCVHPSEGRDVLADPLVGQLVGRVPNQRTAQLGFPVQNQQF